MNTDLAAIYGTPGAEEAQQEDIEKAAEAELFAKLATEAGVDLNQMTDEQIQELYQKVAAETCPKCEKAKGECVCPEEETKDKESAAQAEFHAQREWGEKVAEADYLGRVMAHSMTQELGEIEKSAKAGGVNKALGRAGELLKGTRLSETGAGAAKGRAALAAGREPTKAELKRMGLRSGEEVTEAAKGAIGRHRSEKAKVLAARGAALGTAGAAGYGMGKKSSADGSALDELAVELAVEKAAEAGFDADEAVERVSAVLTLGGPGDSEKLAFAENLDQAKEIRALEFLEGAGYPVTWEE